MDGFLPFFILLALGEPSIVLPALLVGSLCRRWWHVPAACPLPLLASLAYYGSFDSLGRFDSSLPFMLLSSAIWTAAAFALRTAWTR